jgi:hypothetical protein
MRTMSNDGAGLDEASASYDSAEKAYLEALAAGAEEQRLGDLARDVAEAAQAWEAADNNALAPSPTVQRYYEVPEVLASLWADIVAAYDQRTR